jgi:hypothetical protein
VRSGHDTRDHFAPPCRYGTRQMKPFRVAYLAPVAMLAALAAGCAGGGDTANEPESTQPGVTADLVELDGVRFDVRRDPG